MKKLCYKEERSTTGRNRTGPAPLTAALLSLSPPLLFPPVQSLHMVCHFFTHGGLDLCMCSIMPSLDLWYCSSICLSGPSCSTFSDPLVSSRRRTLRISYFPSRADEWRKWEMAIHDAPHESRTGIMSRESRPPRSSESCGGTAPLSTFPPTK